MGTEITLSVDSIELGYSTNHTGIDHGSLFQEPDRKRMKSAEINYEYLKTINDSGLSDMEMGFGKNLKEAASRIELLGFNLEFIRKEYGRGVAESNEDRSDMEEFGRGKATRCMSFDQFLEIVSSITISSLDSQYDEQFLNKDPTSYGTKFIPADQVKMLPFYDDNDAQAYSEQSFVAGILGFLHPYSVLRLLAENEKNQKEEVKWQYGPLVEAGWAKTSEFQSNARREETFLIVTEGHTDADILDLAIKTLRPEISDFFRFIDMTDGHPFGGTGPLQKFARGLAQMDVHNKTLFLFDNDTEGLSAFRKTRELNLPINMRVIMLPDQDEFRDFLTVGPSGKEKMDINGKASAIECYLDLEQPDLPKPIIRWSGFKGDVQQYQGALCKKELYTKDLLKYSPEDLLNSNYDLSKLSKVVDAIYQECVNMAADHKKLSWFGR